MTPGNEECIVCEQPGHGTHFGAYTCRACAAFFRRTVILNRAYPCRSGEESCPIARNERYLCRRCRYNKCLALGMTKDNVKSNADRATSTITKPASKDCSPEITSIAVDICKPSTSCRSEMEVTSKKKDNCSHSFGKSEASTTTSGDPVSFGKPKIHLDLCSLTRNIRTIFETYVPVIDVPIPLTATQRMLLGLKHYRRNQNVNPQYRREITLEEHKTHVAEQFELIAKFMQYSEEFSKLDLEDKLVLFRSSWSMVHRVETVDRSLTLFGDEVFKDHKVACFLKFYVDRRLRYTDTGLGDEEAAKIDEMLLPSTESLIAVVAKPLLELKPTEFELVYIMSQLIWHVEGKGVSVACHEVADSYRERISDELHDYYIHEQRLPRYAERLIKIMELVHAIEDYLYERAQFLNMLNIFNVCKIEVEDADILDKNHV